MKIEAEWITRRTILAMQEKQIVLFGGTPGLRDLDLLESALSRPKQLWNYGDPPPDLQALAASYAFGLIKNHAFLDGNKRIALMAMRLFLLKNGITLRASSADKYTNMIDLAASQMNEENFTQWLRTVTTPNP